MLKPSELAARVLREGKLQFAYLRGKMGALDSLSNYEIIRTFCSESDALQVAQMSMLDHTLGMHHLVAESGAQFVMPDPVNAFALMTDPLLAFEVGAISHAKHKAIESPRWTRYSEWFVLGPAQGLEVLQRAARSVAYFHTHGLDELIANSPSDAPRVRQARELALPLDLLSDTFTIVRHAFLNTTYWLIAPIVGAELPDLKAQGAFSYLPHGNLQAVETSAWRSCLYEKADPLQAVVYDLSWIRSVVSNCQMMLHLPDSDYGKHVDGFSYVSRTATSAELLALMADQDTAQPSIASRPFDPLEVYEIYNYQVLQGRCPFGIDGDDLLKYGMKPEDQDSEDDVPPCNDYDDGLIPPCGSLGYK